MELNYNEVKTIFNCWFMSGDPDDVQLTGNDRITLRLLRGSLFSTNGQGNSNLQCNQRRTK